MIKLLFLMTVSIKSMYENILDIQPFGIAKFNKDGEYLYFNQQELSFRNISKEKIKTSVIFDLFSEEKRQELKDIFHQLIFSHVKESSLEYKIDENYFNMRLVKDCDENIVSTLMNITAQKNNNISSMNDRENIKRLDNALNGAKIGVWDFFPKEGRILANETWVTQKKYKSEKFREGNELFSDVTDGLKRWKSMVHPDDLEQTQALIQKHLDGKTEIYEAEFRMKCGDGKWRWIYDLGRVFQRDEDGTAIRMNGVHIDITKMKDLQAELEEKRAELEIAKNRAEELANRDSLTGLYNRRYFSNIAEQNLKIAQRYSHELSVLMIDVDNFKNINDTYGHSVGDNVIVMIAELLKELSRESDIITRYGGEEFVVMLPETSIEDAVIAAHRVRVGTEKMLINLENTIRLKVTVSIGVSNFLADLDMSIDKVMQRADDNLYEAKRGGKNRVEYG